MWGWVKDIKDAAGDVIEAGGDVFTGNYKDLAHMFTGDPSQGAVPPGDLVKQITHGKGTGSLQEAASIGHTQSGQQNDIETQSRQMMTDLESAYTGAGADAARGQIEPLATTAASASDALKKNSSTVQDQIDQFERLKGSMHTDVTNDAPQRGFVDKATFWNTDHEDEINARNQKVQQNLNLYNTYNQQTNTNTPAMTKDYGQLGQDQGGTFKLDPPKPIKPIKPVEHKPEPTDKNPWQPNQPGNPGDPGGPGNPGGPGGPGGPNGPGSTNGQQTPVWSADQPPRTTGTPLVSGLPPGQTTTSSSYTPPPSSTYTPDPSTYQPGGFGPGGSGGSGGSSDSGGFGGAGSFGGAGGFGGGSGSGSASGSGFGPGGGGSSGASGAGSRGSLGAGSSAGSAAEAEGAGARGGGAGASGGAAGKPGAAGASSGARPPGGKGEGSEDAEHQRPSYLVEADPDSIFGSDERTAPPVIGE